MDAHSSDAHRWGATSLTPAPATTFLTRALASKWATLEPTHLDNSPRLACGGIFEVPEEAFEVHSRRWGQDGQAQRGRGHGREVARAANKAVQFACRTVICGTTGEKEREKA